MIHALTPWADSIVAPWIFFALCPFILWYINIGSQHLRIVSACVGWDVHMDESWAEWKHTLEFAKQQYMEKC